MSTQSKLESKIETTLNIGSGFMLAFLTWKFLVNPMIHYGIISIDDTFIITSIFTVITFIRSYFWRRMFTSKTIHRIADWLMTKWYKIKPRKVTIKRSSDIYRAKSLSRMTKHTQ